MYGAPYDGMYTIGYPLVRIIKVQSTKKLVQCAKQFAVHTQY